MLTLDLKSRFRNKTFILSMIGAIVLLFQQLGFKDLIPSNWLDIVNTIISIFVMLGIVVDTSTPGISDKVIQDTTVQTIKTEVSTIAINNTVTENSDSIPIDNLSASAKINVDIPVEE